VGSDGERGVSTQAGPLAVVVRGGVVESVHVGHLVALRSDGTVRNVVGDPDATIWARSSLKPLQAAAMLGAGLEIDDEGLALACASHSGTAEHLAVVRRVLAGAGLSEADLQNTPDLPLDATAAFEWRRGGGRPAPVTQNCSGKHAAMLATCARNGWDTTSYRSPDHPLQLRVRETIELLTGVPVTAETVDGCGAPLFSTTVRGLALAFGRIAAAASGEGRPGVPWWGRELWSQHGAFQRVGRVMRTYPFLVGGPGRDVSRFMAAVPGLVAKDGAEGVYAAGFADGTGVAFKVADGAARVRPVILRDVLENRWQQDWAAAPDQWAVEEVRAVGHVPVLGHGEPVGEVHAFIAAGAPGSERAVVGGRWE
jgi:L-asparaginase II